MDKTSPSSSPRPVRRPLISASVAVALCAAVASAGSCSNDVGSDQDIVTGGATTNGTTGPGSTIANVGATNGGTPAQGAGTSPGTAGAGVTPGTATTSGAGTSGGPAVSPGATPGSDVGQGATPGSGTAGGSETSNEPEPEPCEDVLPPPDPEWPDATCENWANETEECSEPWFAEYCDISCGRCVPEGGGMSTEPEPEPCEDVLPPPDPEWPDATCEAWAAETEECNEPWFAEYCDISCGRCVPVGGGMSTPAAEPEPEPCEDIEPPEDPEWPGATCAEWATETEECTAAWFADYCDISCGRCIPEGGLPPEPMGPDCSGEGLPQVTGGEGHATRYWDCCQTHCSQFTGHRCGQDGTSGTGDQNSACNGGGSFACYDEAPRAVSDCLSYGHIAKANPDCGQCYRIQFTGEGEHNANDPGSKLIAGKQMIVKVTNTGGDVGGSQFDLMVPGGGVGQFNACSRQWNQSDLGAQYGGFLTDCSGSHAEKKECVRQECMKIPEGSARDGCFWFVDWFEVADNPKFTSQQTDCPF